MRFKRTRKGGVKIHFTLPVPFSAYDVISIPIKILLDCELYFIYLWNSFFFALQSQLLKASFSHFDKYNRTARHIPISISSFLLSIELHF